MDTNIQSDGYDGVADCKTGAKLPLFYHFNGFCFTFVTISSIDFFTCIFLSFLSSVIMSLSDVSAQALMQSLMIMQLKPLQAAQALY